MREEDEVAISLKDVLVYCFLHWRSAIVMVLLGAVLGGAFYGLRARSSQSSEDVAELQAAEAADNAVQLALDTQEANVGKLASYLEDSLLMQIDPTSENVARADISILTTAERPSEALGALAVSYKRALLSNDTLDAVADQLGTTSAYLRELITIDRAEAVINDVAYGSYASGSAVVLSQDEESEYARSTVLSIAVIGPDEETVVLVRDALVNAAYAHSDAAAAVAPHQLSMLSQTTLTVADPSLLFQQVDRANAVTEAQSKFNSNSQSLSTGASAATPATSSGASLPKSALKGALLGGVMAFLLYGLVLCLRYVFTPQPVMRGQVEARYILPLLGSYAFASAAYYKGQTKFDAWLRGLSGLEEPPTDEEVTEMVAANVRLYAGDVKTLLVSSSMASKRAAQLADGLSAKLDGVKIVRADDLTGSPEARGKLKEADATLFVEEYGNSRFESIDDEISLVRETGKTALGLVMA
jgi:hypothetical protein